MWSNTHAQNYYFNERYDYLDSNNCIDLGTNCFALDTGGYLHCGSYKYSGVTERYGTISRVSKEGEIIQKNHFGWQGAHVELYQIHKTSSGDFLAVGNYLDVDSLNRYRPIIASIDAITLDTNWTKILYTSQDSTWFHSYSKLRNDTLIISGTLYVLDSAGNVLQNDGAIISTNSMGDVVHTWYWGLNGESEGFGRFDFTDDLGLIVGGVSTGFGTYQRSVFIKLDSQWGVDWVRAEGPTDAISGGANVINTIDGNIIIYHDEAQEPGVSVIERRTRVKKINYLNSEIWSKLLYPQDVNLYSSTLLENPDSSLVLIRQYYWNLLTKLDKNGEVIWERVHNIGQASHVVAGVIQSNDDDGYLLSGFFQPSISLGDTGNQDSYLIKTNCMGFASPPVANAIVGTADNFEVIVDNNSQYYDYAIWQWGDGTIDTTYNNEDRWGYTPDTLVTHTYGSAGVYNLTLIAGACGDVDTLQLIANAAINGTVDIEKGDFKIYPVPASDHINVQFDETIEHGILTIVDISGKELAKQNINMTDYVLIETDQFVNGMYLITVLAEGKQLTGRCIINH